MSRCTIASACGLLSAFLFCSYVAAQPLTVSPVAKRQIPGSMPILPGDRFRSRDGSAFSSFAQAPRPKSSGGMTLAQALQRTIAANPRLAAAEGEIAIAVGKRLQAGAIPNPEISLELDKILGSGPYRGLRSAETALQ